MAKTASDMTQEELEHYRPDGKSTSFGSEELISQAWEDARRAAELLREEFKATKVIIFGSLAHENIRGYMTWEIVLS